MIPRHVCFSTRCAKYTGLWVFDGGANSPRRLKKLCNELLCNCFVIEPQSPQLWRSGGAKIIYRQSALKRLAGFRVQIDLFSSFVFLFFLTPLSVSLTGSFFLIPFTRRCSCTSSQLIITTSLHSEKSLTDPGGFSCWLLGGTLFPAAASPPPTSPSKCRPRLDVRSCFSENLFLGRIPRRFTVSPPGSAEPGLHVSVAMCLSG